MIAPTPIVSLMGTHWDTGYSNGRDYKVMNNILLDRILRATGVKEGNALDIGCGTGDLAYMLALRGFHVTGIDLSETALMQAQSRLSVHGLSEQASFEVLDIETERSRLSGQSFDLIFCKLVLPFVRDKLALLDWIKAHLKLGGACVLIVPIMAARYEHSAEVMGISIEQDEMAKLLESYTGQVKEFHMEYFKDTGIEITYILT